MKVKQAKSSLCLITSAPCTEDMWGCGGIAPPFLTSTVDGGEWLASRHFRFTPGKRVRGLHYVRGWVGSIFGLDSVDQRKNFLPLPGIELRLLYNTVFKN
jgi:hypothetical protein